MPAPTRSRRWWLIAAVVAWGVALTGLAWWSVDHSPATVPEQRDIGQALPELQRAAGAVLAAANGPGRAVVLGELSVTEGCPVTSVRRGSLAVRDITVHIRTGEAQAAIEAVAARLPAGFEPDVVVDRLGITLHADAGDFIGIDADADPDAETVTVRVSTGCRPLGPDTAANRAAGGPEGSAGVAELAAVLARLGVSEAEPAVRTVTCPSGAVGTTFVVDDLAAPADVAARLRGVPDIVRNGPEVWAYRSGGGSVVVVRTGPELRVRVSTGC